MEKITEFSTVLDQTIEKSWAANDYQKALAEGAELLSTSIAAVGDQAFEALQTGKELEYFLLTFQWPGQAKAFLILWRDVLFQHQKAKLLAMDGQADKQAIGALKFRSKATVLAAAEELKNFPEKQMQTMLADGKGGKKHIEKWLLQTNPWPVYRTQFEKLSSQCNDLAKQQEQLFSTSDTMQQLQQLITEAIDFCETEFEGVKADALKTIEFIDEQAAAGAPGKIAARLEDLEANINIGTHASSFGEALDHQLAALPGKTMVPVNTNGGMLQYREIDFRKRTRLWLESEILPLLYEVWEVTERMGNSMKMSLVNIRNRAILMTTETKNGGEISGLELGQPLHTFLQTTEKGEEEVALLKALTIKRLRDNFEFSKVYSQQREFLPIPLQSTIDQFRLDQNVLFGRARKWFQAQSARLRQVRTDVVQESVLSTSEKVVRYINEHTPDADCSQYSNIFLTKGYIGESFIVGREDELLHVKKIIGNWHLGFRGAVILSGRRFSGKSLFGELVANRFFTGQTIRVSPRSSVHVQGRRRATSYDLGEALDFVEKYTLNEQPLVWIDDLELWADVNISLGQNVRKLCRYIDKLGDRMFFLVSMSSWTLAKLDRLYHLQHVFQTEINLDRMSAEEVRQAILIRHGATHKKLVDEEDREVSPKDFQRMTDRIFRSTDGNIGEVLNLWSASIRRVDEERVQHVPLQSRTLPNLLTPDNTILFRTLILEKQTNEYRLRKTFGPAFKEKYGSILQRMLHVGLLTRRLDGWLEVNKAAVNDLGDMVFEGRMANGEWKLR